MNEAWEALKGLAESWFFWVLLALIAGAVLADAFFGADPTPTPICRYLVRAEDSQRLAQIMEEAWEFAPHTAIMIETSKQWAAIVVHESPDAEKFIKSVDAIAQREGLRPREI